MSKYRKCEHDSQEGAVRLVFETGKPIAQVARELGVNEGTLGNWVAKARRDRGDGAGAVREGGRGSWVPTPRRDRGDGAGALGEDERAELQRLRKENAELRMQRDVLKRS